MLLFSDASSQFVDVKPLLLRFSRVAHGGRYIRMPLSVLMSTVWYIHLLIEDFITAL